MAENTEVLSVYVACLRQIWARHGAPGAEEIASRTQGQIFPMSAPQVEAYLQGEAIPESSMELHVLLYGITDGYGRAWSKGPEEPESEVMTALRLWREVTDTPKGPDTTPLPVVPDRIDPSPPDIAPLPPDFAASPQDIMEVAIEVATYLGAAGIGGIIGNRTDSVVVRAASRLFQSVRDRWQSRGADTDGPLSEEEAVDAAIAAALAHDYRLESLRVASTEQRSDGSWRVSLTAPHLTLRVLVPAGDPADATILIIPE
ncbi:hypothetical protein SAMN04489712_13043 [Thermomonospora echinospora]|uniref:Uncharacterized protein n=1 Tax=Thermomonospora echinospora TaxID=1992 RepID=A0A1H6E326_9ACTN|nr:hypothetical protein [Thermomonospora echinospora]SEG91761.1 hypothetical protein SAMN04489712_13043 [Thermomonospora echinospora]